MEMPIRVIIVLFVAVIVGSLLIVFSKQLLDQARGEVSNIGLENIDQERILELDSLSDQEVLALAEQCVRERSGQFDEDVCFAVFANNVASLGAIDGAQLPLEYTLEVEAASGATALRIIHAPTESRVYVR